MRTRLKLFLAAAVVLLSVTACSRTPEGYVESPVLADYFQTVAPDATKETVSTVSVCSYNDTWYTTVLFDDGLLYHFSVNRDDGSINLESQSTPAQRDRNNGVDFECIGSYSNEVFSKFVESGSYRFELRGGRVVGQVRKTIVIHDQFDDAIKKRLQNAARSIQMAVKLHQQYVPVEKSWGVTP
jgi:hypothetical protein